MGVKASAGTRFRRWPEVSRCPDLFGPLKYSPQNAPSARSLTCPASCRDFCRQFVKTFKSARPLVPHFSQFSQNLAKQSSRTFACRLSCVLSRMLKHAGQLSQAFARLFAENYQEFRRGVCIPTAFPKSRFASCSEIEWTDQIEAKLANKWSALDGHL